ncbi:Site-specific DNA recombinase [Clostridium cavendishii DSM 21758]|uniref:Site-specific DNA recombinase n=1 Tax=Clostridium cavendishii DSM 21758 TaxID=1121302 RepID=A0A1M6LRG5_9CLOT|nr:recombinase family protein [Clostridium cavendishii]SHJ73779.1 Site-specific DNA recombinase [Clostridium cavendishii DSM 21758]
MIIKIPEPEELMLKMATQANNYTAIYARKSNLNSEGCSIETQLSLAKKYAYEHNLLIFKEYSEVLSAVKNDIHNRTELEKLLQDAKSGKFKNLILYRRDRLARTSKDFLILKSKFKKYGVKLHYTADTMVADDSPLSSFIDNILMAVSELEPNNIAIRTANGRKIKRESGYYEARLAPFGFIKEKIFIENKERSYFYPDNTYVDMIKNIFQIYVDKDDILDFSQLRTKLLDENICNLSTEKITNLILHPIYCGKMFFKPAFKFINGYLIDTAINEPLEFTFNNFINCKNVDAIIDENLWFEAICKYLSVTEKKINDNLKTIQKDLFKGKVFCGNCSSLLHKANTSYICTNCSDVKISYNKLIKRLNNFLRNDLLDEFRLNNYIKICTRNINSKLNTTKDELKENIKSQTKYVNLYLDDNSNKDISDKLIILKKTENDLTELILQ